MRSGFWNFQKKWEDIILRVHCFLFYNKWATFISSIKIIDWLASSEFLNLSPIELKTPDWFLSVQSIECTVFILCNSKLTNQRSAKNIFWIEMFFSSTNDESLCYGLQIVELHRSICKRVHSFFVKLIFKSNATGVEQAIKKSKNNVGVGTNHVKLGLALISHNIVFIFGYNNSEVGKETTPNLPWSIKPPGLLNIFIPFVIKDSDKGASTIPSGYLSYSYRSQCETPLYSGMASLKVSELKDLCPGNTLKFCWLICWLMICTSTLERNEGKNLFGGIIREFGGSSTISSSAVSSASTFFHSSLCSILDSWVLQVA